MPHADPAPRLLEATAWKDYELIDTGHGRRLERCGTYRVVRPEPQALWHPTLPAREWDNAHAQFAPTKTGNSGRWLRAGDIPERWQVRYRDLRFWARLTPFRHLAFFPEQASHWDWCDAVLADAPRPATVLNLFGYTGLASLAAARRGAQVTHIDASKKSLHLARENQALSGLEQAKIRWLCDDVVKFTNRETRRRRSYDGIILDPPKYGRGPKSEKWDLFESLLPLVDTCRGLLSDDPRFFLITAYATRLSCVSLYNLLLPIQATHGGTIEYGELVLRDTAASRLVPMAIFARWKSAAKPRG